MIRKTYAELRTSGIERHKLILSLARKLKNSFLYTSSMPTSSSFYKIDTFKFSY